MTTSPNQTPRTIIAARIRALLSKTTGAGATEAEALAAMELAHKLLEKYQLSMSDVELEAEGTRTGSAAYQTKKRKVVPLDYYGFALQRFTSTRIWTNSRDNKANFFGLQSDVDFALYLHETLPQFISISWIAYLGSDYLPDPDQFTRLQDDERDFTIAAATRIGERMRELAEARSDSRMSDGRSLILVKDALVKREFAKLGLHLHRGGTAARARSSDAAGAGRRAGNAASFGRPVGGSSRPLSIGSK